MLHVAESFRTRPRKTRLSSLLHTIHYSAKRQMPNKGEGAVIIFIYSYPFTSIPIYYYNYI